MTDREWFEQGFEEDEESPVRSEEFLDAGSAPPDPETRRLRNLRPKRGSPEGRARQALTRSPPFSADNQPKRGNKGDYTERMVHRERRDPVWVRTTSKDVAQIFGCHPATVRAWAHRGHFKGGAGESTKEGIVSLVRLMLKKKVIELEELLQGEDLEGWRGFVRAREAEAKR